MKIAILIVGIIREEICDLLKNIKTVKNNFKSYETKTFFLTWPINIQTQNIIKNHVDYFKIIDEPTHEYIDNLFNLSQIKRKKIIKGKQYNDDTWRNRHPNGGGSLSNIFKIYYSRKKILNLVDKSNFNPNYCFMIRPDLYIKIYESQINKWLEPNAYHITSKMATRNKKNYKVIMTDHIAAGSTNIMKKIWDMDIDEIVKINTKIIGAEKSILHILQKKNIKIIKHNIKNNDYMLVSKFNGSKIRFYT